MVAPYVGAWIETLSTRRFNETLASHHMWVRGLKLLYLNVSALKLRRTLCGCVD